ncbi:hypothetical protein BD309DRAFT_852814 [Dichomitus squalens]|nr:hypothetical protein BD309DRAFT_852814 [Dichomitus squalens]
MRGDHTTPTDRPHPSSTRPPVSPLPRFPPTFIPVANLFPSHIAGRLYSSFLTFCFLHSTFSRSLQSLSQRKFQATHERFFTPAVMNAKLATRNVMEVTAAAPAAARPSLSVRCPTTPLEKATITELAMTIAEELASLSQSMSPIGIDVPLKHTGLNPKTLSLFHSWLKSAHDYDASLSRLLEDDMTAEVLAADVLASPRTRQARALPKPDRPVGSGSFASRRARRAPRAPISVDVTTEPEEVPVSSAAARQYAADIGMAPFDSWAGKKSSLVYGLLALGLVGSPMSPSMNAIKSPAVPASYNPGSRLRPIAPLEDPRAIMPTRTPIFTSFLDSVRMPGVDAVQSPWVPDRHYASLDGMFAELRFPQTPGSV